MANCIVCKNNSKSGIFVESKFNGKIIKFCSEKCKNIYIDERLIRIKSSYPKYYEKITKDFDKRKVEYKDFYEYMEKNVI